MAIVDPIYTSVGQVTYGLDVVNDTATHTYGIDSLALLVGWMQNGIDPWSACYNPVVTSWAACYAAPTTGWSALASVSTTWSAC